MLDSSCPQGAHPTGGWSTGWAHEAPYAVPRGRPCPVHAGPWVSQLCPQLRLTQDAFQTPLLLPWLRVNLLEVRAPAEPGQVLSVSLLGLEPSWIWVSCPAQGAVDSWQEPPCCVVPALLMGGVGGAGGHLAPSMAQPLSTSGCAQRAWPASSCFQRTCLAVNTSVGMGYQSV